MIPGYEDVADAYGILSAAGILRGWPRPKNDMWIAACCITHNLPLAALNVKAATAAASEPGDARVSPC